MACVRGTLPSVARSARTKDSVMKGLTRLALAATLLASPAFAGDYDVGPLHIGQPWARATPPGAQTGGGYMTVTNNGPEPDRLVRRRPPGARPVEIHEAKV